MMIANDDGDEDEGGSDAGGKGMMKTEEDLDSNLAAPA